MDHLLFDGALQYGVRLSDPQLAQFEQYQSLLEDWSQRMNLVADPSPGAVRSRHFLESIALGSALREREMLRPGSRVLDLGAGAGFPGVVWKIVWPAIELTLLEATSKKADFLRGLVERLALPGTTVVAGRAETLAHEADLRAQFDLVVARAVAPLRVLAELALPFARVGGRLVTPKGSRVAAEVADAGHALDVLGGRLHTAPLRIPGPQQTLVAVVKERDTPPEYPRRPGVPSKSPL